MLYWLGRRSPEWGPLTPDFLSLMEILILDYVNRKEAEKVPPKQVKPCPVTIVLWLLEQVYRYLIPMESDMSMADMIYDGSFFLLCPGKYTGTTTDDTALPLTMFTYNLVKNLSLAMAMDNEVRVAMYCALYFTTQKNLQKGDVIAQSCSLDQDCCPVKALV